MYAMLLSWFYVWSETWYMASVAIGLGAATLAGGGTISLSNEYTFSQVVAARLRQLIFGILAILIIGPLIFGTLAAFAVGAGYSPLVRGVWEMAWLSFREQWTWVVAGALGGLVIRFTIQRYVTTLWSALKRRFRVKQSADALSDVRSAKGKYTATEFEPRHYYRDGEMFLGLDQDNKPICIEDAVWKTQNQKVIGPTQTGKGVLIGVQLDQAIRKGMSAIFFDPKPDKHAAAIMERACKESGRRFVTLDLNESGKGHWAPFAGGSPRDRRSRLLYFIGLDETGSDADFYKLGEREIIDQVFDQWDGQLRSLLRALGTEEYADKVSRTRSALRELLRIDTFAPRAGRGLSVERCLKENAVVYVRGSIHDPVIVKAGAVFIQEVVQETMRLYRDGQRPAHVPFFIDELRFMISDALADALASIAGFDAHISVAYQSLLDLKNLRDRNLNSEAIAESVNVNCKSTVCYMAANHETAEWAAKQSGTVQKVVTRAEQVTVNDKGGEVWNDERLVNQVEEYLITPNDMLMLPERVGALLMPHENARVMRTCWIPLEATPESQERTEKSNGGKTARSSKKTETQGKGNQKGNDAVTLDNVDEKIGKRRNKVNIDDAA